MIKLGNLTTRHLVKVGYTTYGVEVYNYLNTACQKKEYFDSDLNRNQEVLIPFLKLDLLGEDTKTIHGYFNNTESFVDGLRYACIYKEEAIEKIEAFMEGHKEKIHTMESFEPYLFKVDAELLELLDRVELVASDTKVSFVDNKIQIEAINLKLTNLPAFHFCLRKEIIKLRSNESTRNKTSLLLDVINDKAKRRFNVRMSNHLSLEYSSNCEGYYDFGRELDTLDGIRIYNEVFMKEEYEQRGGRS